MKINIISAALIAVVALVLFRQASGLPWTPTRILGVAIAVPALLLLLLARYQLGRAFSVRARATNLVTSGLYSRVRNPIYVFGSLFILGIIIWSGRPIFLLLLLVLVPLQIYRSRKESAVLEAKFGDEYLRYKQQTWF
ncbi:MAG TPA: isoprenylcysteine carboxylmethyltransferase family protein [Terracidiphilus sp.]|jgi:protein-S-isoprenylcysteine O-methyltransferase Ste14|nr:isoprenylcysteine carboxylmethyltransferase family protein [Terracidiphilus sp.]